jgi:type II secretory ATPase GspE/PulE/Tfp pilus assembly ATPase PilB-like protein
MGPAYLQVKDGAGERRVDLDCGPLTIGRNFTNLLVLEEPRASRFHAVIEKVDDIYQLRDLDSRNGTLLNGEPVKAADLRMGDVINIGASELVVFLPELDFLESYPSANAAPSNPSAPKPAPTNPAPQQRPAPIFTPEPESADEESAEEYEPAGETVVTNSDYEKALRERAESLPGNFEESDIILINARGKIAHVAAKEVGEAVTLMRLVLLVCFRSRATDIHIEPKNDDMHVRARVDGMMVDVIRISKELGVKLSSMVKVLSDIDIAQKNIVQEGHFSARVPNVRTAKEKDRRVDYRVSFAPAMHGQKLVIRVLDTANAPLHIDDLLIPAAARDHIRRVCEQDSGMVLVCGPTGSGKTTTLYAFLRDIDSSQRNVITIEDPVEIQLDGVTQIPVNEPQGNTFSALLRSVLRQDPDVLLVGEIRDAETARVAVQAGMTGHLVFSTVHARDAISGMFRLLDLGVEPYVVATGLHLVVAQRLVRQLCPSCKVATPITPKQAKRMADVGITGVAKVYQPKGCRKCLGTGFRGRRCVFEMVHVTAALRETILKKPTVQECQKALDTENFISLEHSGLQMVADGDASYEEMERTIA